MSALHTRISRARAARSVVADRSKATSSPTPGFGVVIPAWVLAVGRGRSAPTPTGVARWSPAPPQACPAATPAAPPSVAAPA